MVARSDHSERGDVWECVAPLHYWYDANMSMQVVSVPIADLNAFEGNARRGNVDAIAESLFTNGQYKPIVVNRGTHTGKPNEVLAGNHTLEAAASLGWDAIECVFVDVDRASALKIVLADNRTNDLAAYDDRELVALLQELPDLDGTAFDQDALDRLLAGLEAPNFEPDDEEDVRLDRKSVTTCPECGHVFTPVTRTATEDDLL